MNARTLISSATLALFLATALIEVRVWRPDLVDGCVWRPIAACLVYAVVTALFGAFLLLEDDHAGD